MLLGSLLLASPWSALRFRSLSFSLPSRSSSEVLYAHACACCMRSLGYRRSGIGAQAAAASAPQARLFRSFKAATPAGVGLRNAVCACMCVWACARARVRVGLCACVRAHVCVRVCVCARAPTCTTHLSCSNPPFFSFTLSAEKNLRG